MAYREVRLVEVRQVLSLWLESRGKKTIARFVGADSRTVRRYVERATEFGLQRAGGVEQLTDEFIGHPSTTSSGQFAATVGARSG